MYKMQKKISLYMLNMGKKKMWGEAHSYKRLVSIFEEVASDLLCGLGVKCLEIQLFGLKKF